VALNSDFIDNGFLILTVTVVNSEENKLSEKEHTNVCPKFPIFFYLKHVIPILKQTFDKYFNVHWNLFNFLYCLRSSNSVFYMLFENRFCTCLQTACRRQVANLGRDNNHVYAENVVLNILLD